MTFGCRAPTGEGSSSEEAEWAPTGRESPEALQAQANPKGWGVSRPDSMQLGGRRSSSQALGSTVCVRVGPRNQGRGARRQTHTHTHHRKEERRAHTGAALTPRNQGITHTRQRGGEGSALHGRGRRSHPGQALTPGTALTPGRAGPPHPGQALTHGRDPDCARARELCARASGPRTSCRLHPGLPSAMEAGVLVWQRTVRHPRQAGPSSPTAHSSQSPAPG